MDPRTHDNDAAAPHIAAPPAATSHVRGSPLPVSPPLLGLVLVAPDVLQHINRQQSPRSSPPAAAAPPSPLRHAPHPTRPARPHPISPAAAPGAPHATHSRTPPIPAPSLTHSSQGTPWRSVRSFQHICRRCRQPYTGRCGHAQFRWDTPVTFQFGLPSPPPSPPQGFATLSPARPSPRPPLNIEASLYQLWSDLVQGLETALWERGGAEPIFGLAKALQVTSYLLQVMAHVKGRELLDLLQELVSYAVQALDWDLDTPRILCPHGSLGADLLASYVAWALQYAGWNSHFNYYGYMLYDHLGYHLYRLRKVVYECENALDQLARATPRSNRYTPPPESATMVQEADAPVHEPAVTMQQRPTPVPEPTTSVPQPARIAPEPTTLVSMPTTSRQEAERSVHASPTALPQPATSVREPERSTHASPAVLPELATSVREPERLVHASPTVLPEPATSAHESARSVHAPATVAHEPEGGSAPSPTNGQVAPHAETHLSRPGDWGTRPEVRTLLRNLREVLDSYPEEGTDQDHRAEEEGGRERIRWVTRKCQRCAPGAHPEP